MRALAPVGTNLVTLGLTMACLGRHGLDRRFFSMLAKVATVVSGVVFGHRALARLGGAVGLGAGPMAVLAQARRRPARTG